MKNIFTGSTKSAILNMHFITCETQEDMSHEETHVASVVDCGIMPSYNAVWGVVHVYFYPCAALLFVCALWLFVAKHRMKKKMRR